ncbi:DHH family phosphoesterase [Alkalibacter mobilis]|uniref:DHH family phosphoesterase n=1 Tax=Alkalibacter mobilis TaxID=2787712 RepID=UPI00189E0EF2|nr:DHH family phosphoesterase [Alkalibacter mobilis]
MLAIFGTFVLIYLIFYKYRSANQSEERWRELVENLQLDMDTVSQNTLMDLPFPLLILKSDSDVVWYNSGLREMLPKGRNILNKRISDEFENFDIKKLNGDKKEFLEYKLNDKNYRIYSSCVKNSKGEKLNMLYWVENTEFYELEKKYLDEMPSLAFIQVDNYDEIMKSSNESYKPLINAVIDQKINSWAKENNAFLNKYEQDQYVMFFEFKDLKRIEEKKFDILDVMRETQSGNKLPITLSIGIGISDEKKSFFNLKELSKSALDIALARGGDQAVIRKDGKISYYGGKTQAVEKRTKVKARLKAHGIKELIENSSKVFIMGHSVPDIDALGAALGIYRTAVFLGKEAYIIADGSNPSIDVLYGELKKENYGNILITSDTARKSVGDNSLLVIVDVHRKSLVQDPAMVDKVDKVIIIDHHIRASEFIEDTALTYIEPYASSTCELVTEIIEYVDDRIELTELEATALLAGIHMDTKGFSIKTGARTFEAASFLRKKGADTLKAKELLKDDMSIIMAKAEALKRSEFIRDKIAVTFIDNKTDKINLITAQTADALLNIQGVEASFVIAQGDEGSIISGRSYGKINVQRILEELGGGGHMNVAGAQLPGNNGEEAKKMLEKAIDEYFEEGELK